MDSSGLLVNLVVALVAGLGGAVIAARLGQSVVLGYILAGVAIGPYTPGFVGDTATVEALAEIGIILLMFAIGVQFSLRDLMQAGRVATLGSTIQVLLCIGLGTAAGLALGWDLLEALFFGAVISNSSSTVLSKVLGERGEMDTGQGKLSLAWSTVQDLGTVILIVLLSALASDSDALVLDLLREVGRAALFLVLLVPIGFRVLPWIFSRAADLRNREIFVLTVAVVALGVAYSASFFGLSLALGAFVAGVVVSESDLSHQILGEILPLRDIFAGLFFVSVGMLVDPGFVIRNLPLLAMTLALIVLVKGSMCAVLAGWLGTPTRTAVLTGAILGQSAEFSFLLARVGRDVGAVSSTGFSLMLAGAAVSIVVMPAFYQGAQPVSGALAAWRPVLRPAAASGPEVEPEPPVSGHAVICGYGRVGRVVGGVLGRRFAFVAIDEDPRTVARLRERGVPAVQGNAAIPAVLEQANPGRARLLVVALPDPIAARQIVDYVRQRYPRLDVVVRTHSDDEREFLLARGVDEVVLGEWELALEMTRHSLQRFGVSTLEIQEVIQRLRRQARTEPAYDHSAAAARTRSGVATRRKRLVETEAATRSGDEIEIARQRQTEADGMGDRQGNRVGHLGDPGPTVDGSDRIDVDQPDREAIEDPGPADDDDGPAQEPEARHDGGEGQPERRAQGQVDDRPGYNSRTERRIRLKHRRTDDEGGGDPERPQRD